MSDDKRYITTIVRLPAGLYDIINEIQEILSKNLVGQYIYPLSDVHMTIRELTSFCLEIWRVDSLINFCRKIFSQVEPFAVHLEGIHLSSSSAFIRAYSNDGALLGLRDVIDKTFIKSTQIRLEDKAKTLKSFGHINIARFVQPRKVALFLDCLKLRSKVFGNMEVSRIELVRTDKLLSAEGTEIIHVYDLKKKSL